MNIVNGTVNGKRVNLPNSASIDDIVRSSGQNFNPNTRCIIRRTANGGNERLKPNTKYNIKPNDKFMIGPDRVKASGETYFGNKEQWRKELILDQVQDISKHFYKTSKIVLDDDCNWVTFNQFKLPSAWANANEGQQFCKMMLIFPDQYPDLPTNGFYLPSSINPPAGDSHFWNRGYSGAFGQTNEEIESLAGAGWKWYCTHIKPGAWQPARLTRISDWRHGDNLWDIFTICKQVLTNPYED